jgi:hypothetical protein
MVYLYECIHTDKHCEDNRHLRNIMNDAYDLYQFNVNTVYITVYTAFYTFHEFFILANFNFANKFWSPEVHQDSSSP